VPVAFALLVLAAAAFTDVMTDLLPAGLLPQMSGALHVPPARIGLLVSAFAIASACAAIPVTALLRGLPRRPVLAAALTGFAVFDAVTAVSASYLVTFVARLLLGIMGGTLWSLLAGYAARIVPVQRRGRAIAIVLGGITAALCLGIPAGTAMAGLAGWRPVFAFLAVLALFLAAVIQRWLPGVPGEPPARRVPLRRVATMPGVIAVLTVTLLVLTGHQAMYTYIAPFLAWSGSGRTSVALLAFGGGTVAGIWLAGLRADRHLRSTLLLALALVATAMLALALRLVPVTLVPVAGWGVGYGAIPALLQTALVEAACPVNADVATGMQTTVYNLGIAAGSSAGGIVLDRVGPGGLPWVPFVLVAASLVIAGVSLNATRAGLRGGR
jgi:predicted MFS family arabinose efflux permease